ncbi:MAG: iron ABC transporter permease [Proteobacteria bacterium]|nr:iron ABC transporter permease [Pseudomonadota bacterium]
MKSLTAALALLFVLGLSGLMCGPATPVDFWFSAFESFGSLASAIQSQEAIFELRTVHVLLAAATGFALASAGRSMQNLLQNTLADPHVVGLSAGSTAFVLFAILFAPLTAQSVLWDWIPAVWIFAFGGAIAALVFLHFLLLKIVRSWGAPSLALAGLFLNAGLAALLMVFFARLSPSGLTEVQSWTLGAIQPYGFRQALILLPFILCPALFLIRLDSPLLMSSFGRDFAMTNGIEIEKLRFRVLLALTLLSAACVCAAGSVGFVGLLVPHLTRRWSAEVGKSWIKPSFNGIVGACVLVCADIMSRTLTAPLELPVGVYTALLSVPFLFAVLLRRREDLLRT